MSFPSVVLSRFAAIPLRTIGPTVKNLSWGSLPSANNFSGIIDSQSRSVWLEVIRQIPSDDPNRRGELTFENPDLADMRMRRADNADGESLHKVFRLF